jgi:hypothetical protein
MHVDDEFLSGALEHLAECAVSRGFGSQSYASEELLLTLDVPHADGELLTYRLLVAAKGAYLSVREEPDDRRLPRFCPERHIVGDGLFCMYWSADQSFAVTDLASAEKWLNLLIDFLRLQRRAERQRRWPNDETWAHGSAAVFQRQAENLAEKLLPNLRSAVTARQLSVDCDDSGTMRISREGNLIFSVWKSPNRFDRRGRRLRFVAEFSLRGRRKVTHGRRASLLEEMAAALLMWAADEQKFWEYFKDMPCCETIDKCPLQKRAGGNDDVKSV